MTLIHFSLIFDYIALFLQENIDFEFKSPVKKEKDKDFSLKVTPKITSNLKEVTAKNKSPYSGQFKFI